MNSEAYRLIIQECFTNEKLTKSELEKKFLSIDASLSVNAHLEKLASYLATIVLEKKISPSNADSCATILDVLYCFNVPEKLKRLQLYLEDYSCETISKEELVEKLKLI